MDGPSYKSDYIHFYDDASPVSSPSSPTSGCVSGDETADSSSFGSSYTKQLKLHPGSSLSELQQAIKNCKELINDSNQCSDDRKWLVRQLVELRLRVQQLEDFDVSSPVLGVSTMGHHFELHKSATGNKASYCDHCSNTVWTVVQGFYVCQDCNFVCHLKCVDDIHQVCVHVIVTENRELEMAICPEIGLGAQQYKCAGCKTHITYDTRWNEPRLCDYSGLYYCSNCHWNDMCEIPARVVHNWDWEKRYVSRNSYQLLMYARKIPLINVKKVNDKLFRFVTEIAMVRKTRKDLKIMVKYLVQCQQGKSLINHEILKMAETPELYSLENLEAVKDGYLVHKWGVVMENCREHITQCTLCNGKGYLCELCKNNTPIFPYDSSAVGCDNCNSYFHRACWTMKHQTCPKCIRIRNRNKDRDSDSADDFDDYLLT